MTPTLPAGSMFVYDRTYYDRHPLRSGEVVLIRHAGGVWVKRVFATEGESFWTLRERMPGGAIQRDPIAPDQVARFVRLARHRRERHRQDMQVMRLRLPPGMVFLVGDGAWSEDSCMIGPVASAGIMGRVIPLPGQTLAPPAGAGVLSFPTETPERSGTRR